MMVSLIEGQETLANATISGDQLQPAVTVLDNGTQVVVWASNGQDGDGYGIYARRLDANGQPLGTEFRVNSVTSLNQQVPSVTPLGNGGFMIFWEQNSASGDPRNNAIHAQRYDASGNPVGGETTLATQNGVTAPKATRLSDGSVMMVWTQSQSNSVGQTFVIGQRFGADGTALTGPFTLATAVSVGGGASLPGITALTGGGYAISWAQSTNSVNRRWDVFTQVYSANNTAVTGPILSCSVAGDYNQRQSALAGLPDGSYVVVYMADGNQDSSGNGIFLRRYGAAGQLLQGDTLVNSYVTGDQQQPSVTVLADGSFVVAWTSAVQDGSGYGVYAQRYDAAGSKIGGDFLLEQSLAGDQVQPALATRPDGGFVAAWAGQDGSGYGIRTREFAASTGAPAFQAQDLSLQAGQSTLAATLVRPSHSQSDALATSGLQLILQYEFIDTNGSAASGHFELNGAPQAAGQSISVTAEQLGSLRFVGGGAAASDSVLVRVSDGVHWSDWDIATAQTFLPASSLAPGQETLANATISGDQLQPAVTVLDNGTQVVVWASNGQDGDGYGIYARRLDANGQPLGTEFRVNSVTSLNQQVPSVTPLGNGGFMIFWEQNSASGDPRNNAIHAQRYDASGNPVGGETTLATQNGVTAPKATRLSDGSVMMVWTQSQSNSVGQTFVIGQRFGADGTALTGPFTLATAVSVGGGASLPGITALTGGGYAISWAQSTNSVNRRWDVFTQVYSANNTAVTGPILSCSVAGDYNQRQSALAGLPDGSYVVVYMADGNQDSSGNGIFLRRYGAAGQLLQGDTLVNSYVTGDQQQPSVAVLADGSFVVAWTSAVQDGSGYGVYAQRYDAAGSRIGGNFLLEQSLAGDQVQPALATRPDGGFVAAWAGQDGSGYGIRTREFTADGIEPTGYATITGTAGNDTLTGTSNRNRIYGLDGNDSLIGGDLDDLLFGGNGNDTIDGLGGSDYILGGLGDDRLTGNVGNDTLDGGTGNDTMFGGGGDDLYFVDSARDVIRELPNEGLDEVRATVNSYALGANLERLVFTGSGDFAGTGNGLDNWIIGGTGNDTLTGGDGTDTLIGGDGDDRFYFDAADAPLQGGAGFDTAVAQGNLGVSLDLAACSIEQAYGSAGNDSLIGTGAIIAVSINGRDGDDLILGSAFNDTLTGGNGSDTLIAGDGDDILYMDSSDGLVSGGAGFDTAYVQGDGDLTLDLTASGIERIFSSTGSDTLTASGSATLVEINGGDGNDLLVGSAFNDTLRGDAGDDTLYGGDGNDVLVGGGGNNMLSGGGGDDRLYVDTTSALLDGGDGDDTVYARYAGGVSLDISAFIEHFSGSTGNDSVTAANAFTAVELIGGDGNDWLTGGIYADNLRGDNGDDSLVGGDGNDTLTGGNGNDTLAGGFGDDSLIGGTGADLFVFATAGGNDMLRDFNVSQGDLIGLAEGQTYTVGADHNGNAVIAFDTSNTITLKGIRATDVSSSWFVIL